MTSVDSRVVTMKFDNAAFNNGVSQTMGILGKLKQSLNFSDSKKGMDDLQASASRFSMSGLTNATTGVSKSFIAMSSVAITAIANITNRAVDAGIQLAKSITTDPIKAGYEEYVTNLNSIQTILANTKASGATLDDVNHALAQLNHYSDKTIYNFSEMARNIGTFTAAGVDLDTSVNSIKGIANLAALSGSNSQQASTAMYQLSQAIAAGRVSLQDWNSVVNAGMGGTTFQRALAQTAAAMGTLDDSSVKLTGKMKNVTIAGQSFRESITAKPGEQSWLTSKVLTATLSQFTGDLTKAQLKAQGFNDAQIKAIQAQAKTAQEAATKVKSLTQLIDVAKETVGSGWAKTWQLVFGDFKEARTAFTNASNTINGYLNKMSNARNKILGDWKKLGGRDLAIESIKNAFQALLSILSPIKKAFEDIFPPMTGKKLFALTKSLEHFTESLKISKKTSGELHRIFAGVFAVFDILWQVIKGVAGVFGDLFGTIGKGSGGVLSFLASIGDMLVAFDEALKKGKGLETFFNGLSAVLQVPIKLIQALAGFIVDLFNGDNSGAADKFSKSMGNVGQRLSPLANLAERIKNAFGGLSDIFGGIMDRLAPLGDAIGKALSGVGKALVDAFSGGNINNTLDVINTGLFAAITLAFRNFVKNGLGLGVDFGAGGMFESIAGTFDVLTGSLKTMQANVQADTLQKIAIAIGILTASVVALALIDSDKLTKSLTAMTVAFGQLLGAMYVLTKISGSAGIVKIPAMATGLILLSTAILILSAAVKVLSTMSWEELAKGLGGVAALLVAVSAASVPLSANASGMVRAGAGIAAMSAGILLLAGAVKIFATMSWGEIAKGLVAMAGALIAVGAAAVLIPANILLIGPGLIAFGAGLAVIAGAMAAMGSMDWGQIAKGLVAMAGALAIIAAAVALIPATIIIIGPGLMAVAAALVVMAGALAIMGKMGWGEIGKSMVVLAGSLLILAGGLTLMIAALPGAAALVVAAAALAVLVPVLVALGAMSWEAIAKGLLTIAGVFVILGVAGLVLGPLVPVILGLGAALLLLGAGIALAGAGALAFATAFTVFAAAGGAGIAVLMGAITALIQKIPDMMKALGQGVIEFLKVIGNAAPQVTKTSVKIMSALLDGFVKLMPKIGKVFLVLMDTILKILVNAVPRIADAGLKIIIGILKAMSDNVGKVVKVATDLIVNFLRALGDNYPRIVDAGVKMIIKFINGTAEAIRNNADDLRQAGLNLAWAIVDGMTGGLLSYGIDKVRSAVSALADQIPGWAKKILGINSPSRVMRDEVGRWIPAGVADGIDQNSHHVEKSINDLGDGALKTMKTTMGRLGDAVSTDINMNPVVAPVLDLTNLQKDATKISGMLGNHPITAGVSFSQAAGASADIQAAQDAAAIASATTPAPEIKLEQNNYSPKALDPVEIYRNTRSQLSLLKEALNT